MKTNMPEINYVVPAYGPFPFPHSLGQTPGSDGDFTKLRYRQGKQQLSNLEKYKPYDIVVSPRTRQGLYNIVSRFLEVDKLVAYLFFAVLPATSRVALRKELVAARNEIISRQSHSTPSIGDLGAYCEQLVAGKSGGTESFMPVEHQDGSFPYLQDAIEVHYWKLVLRNFSIVSAKANPGSPQAVLLNASLYALGSHEWNVRQDLQRLQRDPSAIVPEDILNGIAARIDFIRDHLDWQGHETANREEWMKIYSNNSKECRYQRISATCSLDYQQIATSRERLNTILWSIFIIFLVLTIPFLLVAFHYAKSETPGIGSHDDPDYWWLIASIILTIMATVLSAVPMVKEHRLSPAYVAAWACLILVLISASGSIYTYTRINKAWSSLLNLGCSFLAACAVLILTQASDVGNKPEENRGNNHNIAGSGQVRQAATNTAYAQGFSTSKLKTT